MIKIKQFLIEAKQQTYANNTGQTVSSKAQSYDFEHSNGDFKYLDSYLGTHSFSGQEILWYKNKPVWSMNYYGDVLNDDFKSSFLKTALMSPSLDLPYRGKLLFTQKDYTYTMEVNGNFDKFTGSERVFFQDKLTYELFFHGGKIIDKHFD